MVTFRRMNFCHGICSRQFIRQSALEHFSSLQESARDEAHGCEPIEFAFFSQKTPSLCPVVESRCFTFRLQSINLFFQTTLLLLRRFPATCHTCGVIAPNLSSIGSSFASSNRKKQRKTGKSSELCAVCNRLRSDCT